MFGLRFIHGVGDQTINNWCTIIMLCKCFVISMKVMWSYQECIYAIIENLFSIYTLFNDNDICESFIQCNDTS